MKRAFIPFLLVFAASLVHAQVIVGNYPIQSAPANPTGNACNSSNAPVLVYIPSGAVYTCQNGTYAQIVGGGGNGFPITIGSTSIGSSSTTTSISGLTLVAPALGTPSALVLSNATGLPAAQVLSGALVNGMTATTQSQADGSTKLATTSYVDTGLAGKASSTATVPTVVDTSSPVTVSTTNPSEFHFNENATAATAMTYNLPTAVAGKQFCISNAYNGSAANTGVLTIATSASGQFIVFTDGTLTATGGNITSAGAAADAACVAGVDSTHWMLYVQRGTWTKH